MQVGNLAQLQYFLVHQNHIHEQLGTYFLLCRIYFFPLLINPMMFYQCKYDHKYLMYLQPLILYTQPDILCSHEYFLKFILISIKETVAKPGKPDKRMLKVQSSLHCQSSFLFGRESHSGYCGSNGNTHCISLSYFLKLLFQTLYINYISCM